VASLAAAGQAPLAWTSYFPSGMADRERRDLGLRARATAGGDGYELRLQARAFARWVSVQADGYECEDQYFHLLPGTERTLRLTARPGMPARALRGQVDALNASAPVQIELDA
jgi:beta-mannosidase